MTLQYIYFISEEGKRRRGCGAIVRQQQLKLLRPGLAVIAEPPISAVAPGHPESTADALSTGVLMDDEQSMNNITRGQPVSVDVWGKIYP